MSEASPAIVLDLIAQAELKIKNLELWRDNIHSDACLLLARIQNERLERAGEIEHLCNEVKFLQERSVEAERVACRAIADRENALILCEMADARAREAEEKAEAAERRAHMAEEWLSKLQTIMANEFFDESYQ